MLSSRLRGRLRVQRASAQPRLSMESHRAPLRTALEGVGPVDGFDVQALPEVHETVHRTVEVVRMAGQGRGVDGPGRGAADDREGRALSRPGVAPQLRNGRQHPTW